MLLLNCSQDRCYNRLFLCESACRRADRLARCWHRKRHFYGPVQHKHSIRKKGTGTRGRLHLSKFRSRNLPQVSNTFLETHLTHSWTLNPFFVPDYDWQLWIYHLLSSLINPRVSLAMISITRNVVNVILYAVWRVIYQIVHKRIYRLLSTNLDN